LLDDNSHIIRFETHNDDLVETDEVLEFTLQANSDDAPYALSDQTKSFTRTIANEDLLTISFNKNDGQERSNSGDQVHEPFSYYWDKEIANDVPTIELILESTCTTGNCAELEGLETDDFEIRKNGIARIHTQTLDTIEVTSAKAIDAATSFPVNYKYDQRVEANETVQVTIYTDKSPTGTFQTNVDGRPFIKEIGEVGSYSTGPYVLSALINNDDYLDLVINNVTGTDATQSTCEGLNAEEDKTNNCNVYNLSWGETVVDDDAGEITLPITLSDMEDSSKARYVAATNEPQDYAISINGSEISYGLPDGQPEISLGTGLIAGGSVELEVEVIDENFVEPSESFAITMDPANAVYIETVDGSSSAYAIEHTIAIQDILTVTVAGDNSSGVEAGDAEGVVSPFSYTTDNPIAANTPNIKISANSDCKTTPCAGDQDYTASVVVIHTGSYSPPVTGAKTAFATIYPDNIVEANENVELKLEISEGSEYASIAGGVGTDANLLNYTINNRDIVI